MFLEYTHYKSFIYRNYKCKHIVAVLLHINAAKTFDKLSSTDQPQKWGKEHKERVKEKYQPRAIIDLPCAKKVCKYILILKVHEKVGQARCNNEMKQSPQYVGLL